MSLRNLERARFYQLSPSPVMCAEYKKVNIFMTLTQYCFYTATEIKTLIAIFKNYNALYKFQTYFHPFNTEHLIVEKVIHDEIDITQIIAVFLFLGNN